MTKFGWCIENRHQSCTEEFARWYIGPVGRGRKKSTGVIYTGETITCSCSCHTGIEAPKPKTRRRKK